MITQFKKENSWLSNFEPVEIKLGEFIYPSVEHAYMSAKNSEELWKEFCADKNNSAGKVKNVSKVVDLVPNWEDIKLQTMYDCLIQKFNKESFKTLLLATGEEVLQEGNYWGDKFWGVDLKSNEGENNLGKLIMKIRTEIKNGE